MTGHMENETAFLYTVLYPAQKLDCNRYPGKRLLNTEMNE